MGATAIKIKQRPILEPISASNEVAGLLDPAAKIAELAYYKAEQRGFEAGHEMDDWLEAERELNL